MIAKAFRRSDEIAIAARSATILSHGESRAGAAEITGFFTGRDHSCHGGGVETAQDPDRIDLLQLHNIRMEQVYDDQSVTTLEKLKETGKIRCYGIALGPAVGWLYEGVNCIRERDITSVQHIYNLLEQHPGLAMQDAATEARKDTMFLIRVTHSSGMLEGKYTVDTVFPPGDHRNHRPRSWLLNGVKKIDRLRFLENSERTLGQAALQWLLADDRIASTLPNIYEEAQLINLPGRRSVRRLQTTTCAGLLNSTKTILARSRKSRNSKERWNCQRKRLH